MNETGPEAVPPPAIFSREERIVDRLLPAPEPNLNSIASVLARSMIEDIVSCTELMKHAEHCGFSSMPTFNSPVWFNVGIEEKPQCSACFINSVQDTMSTLNQTGELNAIF